MAENNTEPALIIDGENSAQQSFSFAALSERSNQVANFFRRLEIRPGDRMLVMLQNEVTLWETVLAACKLGLVIIPTSTMIGGDDLDDRLERGHVQHVIATSSCKQKFGPDSTVSSRILVGAAAKGWIEYKESYAEPKQFAPEVPVRASDPLLLYFTSGTTSKPKMVLHSQYSYPIGHLSTMYWIGIKPGMSIGTLVLQAGRSTLGVHSSLHGMRAQISSACWA